MRETACLSVRCQTREPLDVVVEQDNHGEGPAVLRQRAVEQALTEWVAFLDDDDWMGPDHLSALWQAQRETGADYLYPWYTVHGGEDPMPQHFGRPWDPAHPHLTTITTLVRRSLVLDTGGFLGTLDGGPTAAPDPLATHGDEDWLFTQRANAVGAHIHHLPERTWHWRHWAHPDGTVGNTSGLPHRAALAEGPGWIR